MTTTQSPSDSEYLEWVMAPLKPNYRACQRCGTPREVKKGKMPAPLCEPCQKGGDNGSALRDKVDTPCFAQPAFWELEGEAQEAIQPDVRLGKRRRLELVAKYEGEVQQEFCGQCPLVAKCLQWGRDEGYTGLAGGHWLKDGQTWDEIYAERKPQANQFSVDPDECKRGHSMVKHSITDGRGFRRCRECKRITDRESYARKRARELVAA